MTTLDFSIVHVALPSTRRDLGPGPALTQPTAASYGLALFTAASAACGLAPTGAAPALAAFAVRRRRAADPLLDLALLSAASAGLSFVRAGTAGARSPGERSRGRSRMNPQPTKGTP
ncbi:hypothetical protein ACSNOI_31230 [Actinomadura kijaniata]|uniref:hypothetical protein n=1 Tax=Actinomadura kijaniata TaxID=46161 RepID=UPI003F19F4EB